MTRKAGVSARGLGMELRRHREKAGLNLDRAGAVLGWSSNTMSRMERGLRPDTTPDEVSALLAIMGVVGPDRDRTMQMAFGFGDQGWWESHDANLSDQARTYLGFEKRASRIVDLEPLLVPGLLQTPEYMFALFMAFGVDTSQITGRIARRLHRQELLDRWEPPELVCVLCELSLRQPIGGPGVMSRQLRHIAAKAEKDHISVRIIPAGIVAHPALRGAFVWLEFDSEPSVVFIESRGSAMFPDDPMEVEEHRLAVERSIDVALAGQESQELLLTIAEDLERAR
ncbi:helix-turn-helix domain-containing protein [Actinophytocola gossypii]|uniref:Helix-turn-helix domain-containing protein n=1 Tax=Actinophytocola gossypii TaxID=2812003 RepID=A0ABT2JJD2_9PSEU|nr:helix-turn-helix transcriptional regulator [Actinophytocola gossypii]MCT2587831.1 helix-turn-helix domain-containing protein [Actinophytocola gossypii]